MQSAVTPMVKDLVLVGGGHAHVGVLRNFGMRPLPGVRLTVIGRDIHTPYSGMLPGYIAGFYRYDDCHIDLGPLARFAGARLIHAEVRGLDLEQRQVLLDGRPPVPFDLLSLNTGSTPGTPGVRGADEFALPVKPIDRWLAGWESLQQRVIAAGGNCAVAVVGGGAGGVELALATHHRLTTLLAAQGMDARGLRFTLVTDGPEVLPTHNRGVQRRFRRVLAQRGIEVLCGHRVTEVTADRLVMEGGATLAADAVLWVTDAAAPAWPGASGLAVDERGFVRVDACLRSLSHPQVFAAGDVASMRDPRPKSGVFAVRQGPVLAENLRRAAQGRALRRYRAQHDFLGLISTGDRYAVASRGRWSLEGAWVWRWKDRIDRRFMQRFNELPRMPEPALDPALARLADDEALQTLRTAPMRCGGCGAKVGVSVLERVMQRLPSQHCDSLAIGLDAPDDAAVIEVPAGMQLVQSVDYFRAFVEDPFVFGGIAANHALGDLFAMGAEVHSALAVATVPFASERIVEAMLHELMSGALAVIAEAGGVLAGGHSGEGAELAFGLAANGLVDPRQLMRKAGLRPGDLLILGKPLGTGTLLAADMRGLAKGRWVEDAIASMLVSNRAAAACLRRHGARACTDVTGFGLLGHVMEMARASRCDVEIVLDRLPVLEGAAETLARGVFSSLQPQNLRLRRTLQDTDGRRDHPRYPLLFDPQTAGGLVAGIEPGRAEACLAELRAAGYASAAVIGKVMPLAADEARASLR